MRSSLKKELFILFSGLIIFVPPLCSGGMNFFENFTSCCNSCSLIDTVLYGAGQVMCFPALFVLLLSQKKAIRYSAAVIFCLMLSAELAVREIQGHGIFFSDMLLFSTEYSLAGEALVTFSSNIISGIMKGIFVTALLVFVTERADLRFSVFKSFSVLALSSVLAFANIGRIEKYPFYFKIPALACQLIQNKRYCGERENTMNFRHEGRKYKNIIFIVDESIRGDFLQMNGCTRETTPYLQSIRNRIVNYGTASSAGNLSMISNLVLYSGIREKQLPDREFHSLRGPNLFQYAKQAGYKTCYFDAQAVHAQHQNYMSKYDFKHIDIFKQAFRSIRKKGDEYNDRKLSGEIRELLDKEKDKMHFIFFNKIGAHFSYERRYPDSRKIFRPAMKPGSSIRFSSRERVLNSYSNVVRWAVDDFFRDFLKGLDLKDTLIIYTSDHGQSIKEGRSMSTHGKRIHPPSSQACVPLFLIGDDIPEKIKKSAELCRDNCSHFGVFPSLLVFMGYSEKEVSKNYSDPLWKKDCRKERFFFSGDIFARGCFHRNRFEKSAVGKY